MYLLIHIDMINLKITLSVTLSRVSRCKEFHEIWNKDTLILEERHRLHFWRKNQHTRGLSYNT